MRKSVISVLRYTQQMMRLNLWHLGFVSEKYKIWIKKVLLGTVIHDLKIVILCFLVTFAIFYRISVQPPFENKLKNWAHSIPVDIRNKIISYWYFVRIEPSWNLYLANFRNIEEFISRNSFSKINQGDAEICMLIRRTDVDLF